MLSPGKKNTERKKRVPNLKFNTKIYKKEAIQEAVSAYTSLAKFRVKDNKDYIKVKIEDIDAEVKDILIDEFANYVLGMTKKCL